MAFSGESLDFKAQLIDRARALAIMSGRFPIRSMNRRDV
jgi:hypothetical protein